MLTPLTKLKLFSLRASTTYAERVAANLGHELSPHEEREFEDGEHKIRPLTNVRNCDVFVIGALYGDKESVNDKFCKLLFFLGALRDASAARVTAVVPYLCYARKDRKTKFRDPITTRYVAAVFEAVGVDGIVTLDVHNLAAYQNAFRCVSDHLEARMMFVDYFAPLMRNCDAIVISPDEGGLKRADSFRRALNSVLNREIPLGFMEKRRSRGEVSGTSLFADVKDRAVIIIDDLIGTGTTLTRCAMASRQAGATTIYAAASHGLFVGEAERTLSEPVLDRIIITDSVPPFRLSPEFVAQKIVILNSAPLLAEAIRRIHEGGSVSDMLGPED